MSRLRLLGSLLRHELVEAADLRYLVDIRTADLHGRAVLRAGKREAVGVGQDVNGLAPLCRIFADQAHDFLRHLDLELLRRIFHDFLDVLRRQRLKVDFGTARTQRRIDMRSVARRRTDEYEIGRRPFFEKLPYIRRHLFIRMVVIGRLKERPLVLEHFQELVLQHLVHLADLVDEENAAVRLRHKTRLRLGYAAVRKVAPRPLVDGIVHRA